MKDGWYKFTSERSSYKTIAQLINGKWYLVGEETPVTMEEINRRGWTLDRRVRGMKVK